jgi:hypothetical protein
VQSPRRLLQRLRLRLRKSSCRIRFSFPHLLIIAEQEVNASPDGAALLLFGDVYCEDFSIKEYATL